MAEPLPCRSYIAQRRLRRLPVLPRLRARRKQNQIRSPTSAKVRPEHTDRLRHGSGERACFKSGTAPGTMPSLGRFPIAYRVSASSPPPRILAIRSPLRLLYLQLAHGLCGLADVLVNLGGGGEDVADDPPLVDDVGDATRPEAQGGGYSIDLADGASAVAHHDEREVQLAGEWSVPAH